MFRYPFCQDSYDLNRFKGKNLEKHIITLYCLNITLYYTFRLNGKRHDNLAQ